MNTTSQKQKQAPSHRNADMKPLSHLNERESKIWAAHLWYHWTDDIRPLEFALDKDGEDERVEQ